MFHRIDTGKKCSRDAANIGRRFEDFGSFSYDNVLDSIRQQPNILPRPSDDHDTSFLVEVQWQQPKFDPEINDSHDLAAQVDDAPDIGWSLMDRSHLDLFVNFLDLRDRNSTQDITHFQDNPLLHLCRCVGRRHLSHTFLSSSRHLLELYGLMQRKHTSRAAPCWPGSFLDQV